MAPQTKDDSFTEEVENRLLSIFGDEDSGDESWEEDSGANAPEEAPPAADDPIELVEEGDPDREVPASEQNPDPLRKLKTIVLSIDWEINETVMTGFVEQVAVVQDHYRGDKIVMVFLQLLGSLGEYIRVNLGKSHPESFRVLNSLFNQLETVVGADHLSETEKKKILSSELARYKQLKSKLAPKPARSEAAPAAVDAGAGDTPTIAAVPQTGETPAVPDLIAELKSSLMAEIKALRTEVRNLKEALAKRG